MSTTAASTSEHPFSIILVDDEAIVREGIRDRIDWAALGFRLTGVFEDGRAALQAIRSAPPDAVLTDIRMPFLDGIELTRTVAEEYPAVRSVLLTGHDEFDYAQEAVRLQVWDFLLKPISSRELTRVLSRLAEELAVDRTRAAEAARLRERWAAAQPMLRERALNDLLMGEDPVPEAVARLAELGVSVGPGRVRVALVSLDRDQRPPRDLDRLAVATIAADVLAEVPEVLTVTTTDGDLAVIHPGLDGPLFDLLDRIRREVSDRGLGSVTVAVGPAYGRLSEIRQSFAIARRRLMQRFLTGGNRIISAEPDDAAGSAGDRENHDRTELPLALRTMDRGQITAALAGRIEACRSAAHSVDRCILELQRDLARVIDTAEALEVPFDSLYDPGDNPFRDLAELPSLDAIEHWFAALLDRIVGQLEDRIRTQAEVKVRAAEDYLREHFRDPGLSLTEVCADLSVSVSYFSQRFKMITGKTFVEYLTELRIEHARELLRTGAGKSYEIAPMVGFRDPHYFSATFKKVCGVTPTQYRRQVRKEE